MKFRIKDFLRRSGMTQYTLAEKLGCNQSLVATWTTGRGYPTYEKLCRLVEIGMKYEEIFGVDDTPARDKSSQSGMHLDVMPSPETCKNIFLTAISELSKGDVK